MRAHRVALVLTLAAVLAASPAPHAQRDSVDAFVTWAEAVVAHKPGTSDASLQTVWAMTPDDAARAEVLLGQYLRVLLIPPVPKAFEDLASNLDDILSSTIDRRIIAAGIKAKKEVTARTFLERGAMLHADAAMFDKRPVFMRSANSPPLPRPPADRPRGSTFAPLTDAVVIGDGEVSGVVTPNWNWRFARLLIDQMKPFGPDDGFVSAWYHGTASFLLRRRDFSEGTDHLDHAVQVLPNDARILFDRGTVYESLAMNLFQQASLGSVSRPAVTLAQGIVIHPSDTSVTLPDPAVINTRARRLYERAVAINPGLIEAHVRLAREMELSGEFAAASREVTAALKLDPATDLAFYAHLFGARAANALGHDAEAETHVTAALALYPDADSAWLAASQTALRRADPGTALERLGRLEAVTRTVVDPWLVYPLGAGRLAELALTELWGFKPATAPQ